jgi:hypothetical protein
MFAGYQVWCCDTEYGQTPDGRPDIRCLVAKEMAGKHPPVRLWCDELRRFPAPPFDISDDSVFVAYNATAELGCFLELGWPMPRNIVDLWPEYCAITNGERGRKERTRLIDMMSYYHLDHIAAVEKADLQQLALRGPPYTDSEKRELLEYCESDVDALLALLRQPEVVADLAKFHPREILFRGRFMAAQTRSNRTGIPLDVPLLEAIREHRGAIYQAVIDDYETRYGWGIFENGEFRNDRAAAYLVREGIRLPVTRKTRRPSFKDEVLKQAEERYPQLAPLRECRRTLEVLSRFELSSDADGRSRFFANNFGTITGRNRPPGKEFVFLLPGWARFLIQPPPGYGIGYLDYSAQEVIIAAALSGDEKMIADYYRDIYIQQAIKQGRAPVDATKASLPRERDVFKTMVLGMNYGQTEFGLSTRLAIGLEEARDMRRQYLDGYPRFARWRQSYMNGVRRRGRRYFTPLGWPLWTDGLRRNAKGEPRSRAGAMRAMSNHPVQATGGDMMRLVMVAATEAGIEVCASLHDGFLVIAPQERLDRDVAWMTRIMKAAGKKLLGVEVMVGKPEIFRWPDRFVPEDKKGSHATFALILRELNRLGADPLPTDSPCSRVTLPHGSPPNAISEVKEIQGVMGD